MYVNNINNRSIVFGLIYIGNKGSMLFMTSFYNGNINIIIDSTSPKKIK